MTAIVGLVSGGSVYIGGDSAGSDGYSLTVRATADLPIRPKRRVKTALGAAERFSTGVRGPFTCLALHPDKG
jgi:hypothetical protein